MSAFRVILRNALDEARFLAGPGRATLLVLLGVPIVYPLIMAWLYSANVAVQRPVLVVDDDRSALSRQLQLDLDATQEVAVTGRPADVAEGLAAVRRGEAEMLLWIPPDYSQRIKHHETARLPVWVDSANLLTYAAGMPGLSGVVQAHNETLGRRFFLERGMTTALAEARVMPVVREDRVLYRPGFGYGDFLISGVYAVVVQQIVLIGLMVSFGLAAERGLRRGHGRHALADLAGRALAHLPFYLSGSAILVFGMYPLAGWTVVNGRALFGLFALLTLVAMPMSATFARLAKDRFDAFLLLMFLSTPSFMASGYAWPTDQMPAWVQAAAATLPLTPALKALRTVATATGDLSSVLPELAHIGVLGLCWSGVLVASVGIGRWIDARRGIPPAPVSKPGS